MITMTLPAPTTMVVLAGFDKAHADTPFPPKSAPKEAKGWLDALPILAGKANGYECRPETIRTVMHVYGETYTIRTVNRIDKDADGEYIAGVRVWLTPKLTEEDRIEMERVEYIGTGRYKGAISRKV